MAENNNRSEEWRRVAHGLVRLRKGLDHFVDRKSRTLYNDVYISGLTSSVCNTCQINKHCHSGANIIPKCYNNTFCKNKFCDSICDRILSTYYPYQKTPIWANTDSTKWSDRNIGYWEVAKCFLNTPGYLDKEGPNTTDSSGLISICLNNKGIRSSISNVLVFEEVRDIRNKISHTADYKLDKQTADEYLEKMIELLNDARELRNDPFAIVNRRRLQDIKDGKIKCSLKTSTRMEVEVSTHNLNDLEEDEDYNMFDLNQMSDERIQFTAILVNMFSCLKEEMEKRTALRLMKHILPSAFSYDMDEAQLVCRRRVVDDLLKRIIFSSCETVKERFRQQLAKDKAGSKLAKKLEKCKLSNEKITEFRNLQKRRTQPNFEYSQCVRYIALINPLTDADMIADRLLSAYIINLEEHSNIVHAQAKELKLYMFKTAISRCDKCVLPSLKDICWQLEIRCILCEDEERSERGYEEKSTVEAVLPSPNVNWFPNLGMCIKSAAEGSIILTFDYTDPFALDKCLQECKNGSIVNFVKDIFTDEPVLKTIPEGEHNVHVEIKSTGANDITVILSASFLDRKNSEKYVGMAEIKNRNEQWWRVAYGLVRLRKGLDHFVDRKSRTLYNDVYISGLTSLVCNTCQINKYCTSGVNKKPKRNKNNFCKNKFCDSICDRILSTYYPHDKKTPIWANTDSTKWSDQNIGYWEVAKCFLGCSGYLEKIGPNTTDASGLLSICLNNTGIRSSISNVKVFKEVYDIRNKVFHTADCILDKQRADEYLEKMIELLNDSGDLRNDPFAIVNRQHLQNIKDGNMKCSRKISTQMELEGSTHDLKNVEEDEAYNTFDVNEMSDERIQFTAELVNMFSCLKEEMQMRTALRLMKHILPSALSYDMDEAKPMGRRRVVDDLLKRIIFSSCETVKERFKKQLAKDKAGSKLAKKLEKCKLSNGKITEFQNLQKRRTQKKLEYSQCVSCIALINPLMDVDTIADKLLSAYIINLEEHSNIVHAQAKEIKLYMFKTAISRCDKCVLPSLKDICKQLEIRCVLCEDEERSERGDEKKSTVTAVLSSPNVKWFSKLGMCMKSSAEGSIILTFGYTDPFALEKCLKECKNGGIDNFVKDIFTDELVLKTIPEGEHNIHVDIKSTGANEITVILSASFLDKKKTEMCHQHDEKVPEHDVYICEELEVTSDLISQLQAKHVLPENISFELFDNIEGRRNTIHDLLCRCNRAFDHRQFYEIIRNQNGHDKKPNNQHTLFTSNCKIIKQGESFAEEQTLITRLETEDEIQPTRNPIESKASTRDMQSQIQTAVEMVDSGARPKDKFGEKTSRHQIDLQIKEGRPQSDLDYLTPKNIDEQLREHTRHDHLAKESLQLVDIHRPQKGKEELHRKLDDVDLTGIGKPAVSKIGPRSSDNIQDIFASEPLIKKDDVIMSNEMTDSLAVLQRDEVPGHQLRSLSEGDVSYVPAGRRESQTVPAKVLQRDEMPGHQLRSLSEGDVSFVPAGRRESQTDPAKVLQRDEVPGHQLRSLSEGDVSYVPAGRRESQTLPAKAAVKYSEINNEFQGKLCNQEMTSYMKLLKEKNSAADQQELQKDLNEWKNFYLNIAVVGERRSGKSALINAILSLTAGDKDGAPVGVTETKGRINPKHPNLVFWDCPGEGTLTYKKKQYHERLEHVSGMQLSDFDFFLISFNGRFSENDLWFAKYIQTLNKKVFFCRTHIDNDVSCDERALPKSLNKKTLLKKMKDDILDDLSQNHIIAKREHIFLVDCLDTNRFDFIDLMHSLITNTNTSKRDTMILSLSNDSNTVIEEKVNVLEKRIHRVALLASLGNPVPVVGTGLLIDADCVLREAKFICEQLGIDDNSITEICSNLNIDKRGVQIQMDMKIQTIVSSTKDLLGFLSTLLITDKFGTEVKSECSFTGSLNSEAVNYQLHVYCLNGIFKVCVSDARKAFAVLALHKRKAKQD